MSYPPNHKFTRGNFANEILPRWGCDEATARGIVTLMAWMQAEGDAGRFNPLNTVWKLPGSTDLKGNSAGVQNYKTFWDGIRAAQLTLNYGAKHDQYGFRLIRHCLITDAHPLITLEAVEVSAWGTGGLAKQVYKDYGEAKLLSNEYLHHRLVQ